MGIRRVARERVVQFLFQHDVNPPEDVAEALGYFWDTQRTAALAAADGKTTWGEPVELPPPTIDEVATAEFADPLIRGVLEHRDALDALIISHAENWDLHRMAVVDRNILRLAAHEMLHREDIPPVVSINEAVDIAKKFSTEESGRFVNGILDKICADLERPARTATA
jgi:N utilization substance protein B